MSDRGRRAGESDITVLFVDDYEAYATAGEEYLQKVDGSMTVLPESNAQAGLERLDDAVDCVVCDYQMPTMNGLEFLETVRERFPGLPFVLLTGHDIELPESAARPAGRTDVLQKGNGTHTFEQLRDRIRDVVPSETGFHFDNDPVRESPSTAVERSAEPSVGPD